jgi:hypothetical protein
MSYVDQWQDAVMSDERLTTTEKLVAIAISKHAIYSTGKNAYPSRERVASMASCSVRSVGRARKKLVQLGWMTEHLKGGRNATTSHDLIIPDDRATESRCRANDNTSPRHTEHVTAPMTTRHRATESPKPYLNPTKNKQEESPQPAAETATHVHTPTRETHRPITPPAPPMAIQPDAAVPAAAGGDDLSMFEEAIKHGYQESGCQTPLITSHHRELIFEAIRREWTPDMLMKDVAVNIANYSRRNVNWSPRFLLSDMGTRSTTITPETTQPRRRSSVPPSENLRKSAEGVRGMLEQMRLEHEARKRREASEGVNHG